MVKYNTCIKVAVFAPSNLVAAALSNSGSTGTILLPAF